MHGASTDVVAVFGQIGQVAEVSEGADHAHRLVTAQALEQLFQRFVSFLVGITAEGHGELAYLFDQVVSLGPFLFADHFAQQPTQQADVVNQRLIFVDPFAQRSSATGFCG